jgi:hypothetical protein
LADADEVIDERRHEDAIFGVRGEIWQEEFAGTAGCDAVAMLTVVGWWSA